MKTKLDEIDRQIIRYKRQGFSQSVIAQTLGLTESAISYRTKIIVEEFGKTFYKEEFDEIDKQIIRLKNKGVSNNEIASCLGLTPQTISKKVSRIVSITGTKFPPKKRSLDEIDEQIFLNLFS